MRALGSIVTLIIAIEVGRQNGQRILHGTRVQVANNVVYFRLILELWVNY